MIPFFSSHLIKMAGISSKLSHCAPPLLQTFHLSNHLSFSLHQNSKAAIFSDRLRPFILTKSPLFPPHPQNLSFGLFPSMVSSSVDRISSDEWRHHEPSLAKVITCFSNSIDPSSAVSASAISPETSHNSAATATVAAGTPLTGRLEQMWTELDAEAGVCRTPPPTATVENLSGRSDACDESELSAKEITENSPAAALSSSPKPSPTPSPTSDTGRELLRVMLEMEDFILKLDDERRWEIAMLAERQLASRFSSRGHSEPLIRLSSSQQEVVIIRNQQWPQKLEAERLETESNHILLRKRLVDRSRRDINEVSTEENMHVIEVQPTKEQQAASTESYWLLQPSNSRMDGVD